MALSDVTVKVNLVTSVGVEPVWFPLLFVDKSNDPTLATKIPYTECTSLGQLETIIAAVTDKDTKAEKKAKQEKARGTALYQAAHTMFLQSGHPNRFAVVNAGKEDGGSLEKIQALLAPYLDKNWRQLVAVNTTELKTTYQLMDWVENLEQRKLFFLRMDPANATYTDTADGDKKYALSDYTRTVAVYGADTSAVYSVVGATSGKVPGSLNYRNVIVQGAKAAALSAEELEALHTSGIMALVERAGDVVTSTGKSASGDRYLDTIDIEDYVVEQLIYSIQRAMNVNDIVPYNNDGIAILENAAAGVMLDCCDKGMIVKTDTNSYDYQVSFPGMTFVPQEDIANREYKLGTVAFTVQGAIDRVAVTVDMTI